MYRRLLLVLPMLLLVAGCSDLCGCTKVYQANPTAPTPTPTPTPVPVSHLVEFRVTGTVNITTITSSDTNEGVSIVTTGIPWFQQFKITKDTFLYLDAQSFEFGVLHVQIYVDGALFREAFTTNGNAPKIAVSGQYHVSN